MEIKLAKQAILTPLIGLVIGWTLFMFAIYSDLFNQPISDYQGNYISEAPIVKVSTYLYLIGVAVFGLLSLRGQQMALHSRELAGLDASLPRAAHRFTNLTVVISLAGGSIYAISNFLNAFNGFGGAEKVNLLVRLFDVYVPIVLATILVIFILLRAFVFRKQNVKETKKQGLSESEKALGLGYAIPILFTAVAIIFGLVVYDTTRTDLQVWVWVVIQVIVALGILLGTRFSSRAKAAKESAPRVRQTLAAGAANLNFVLSIVFGATVSIMSFSFGASAIEALRIYPEYKEPPLGEGDYYDPTWKIAKFEWKWFFETMFPALVLLLIAAVGIYLFITERNNVSLVPVTKKTPAKVAASKKTSGKKTVTKPKTTNKKPAPRKRK